MSYYMGTQHTPPKSKSTESSRPYEENGVKKSGNSGLKVASRSDKVIVQESSAPALSTDSSGNASAVVLRGDDLQALSDDPDDLSADLQALAGPSAGPNGGSIFVDGFSGGQLPSKESIREIR